MPEDISHNLTEDLSGTVQSFDSSSPQSPTELQLSRHFCVPLGHECVCRRNSQDSTPVTMGKSLFETLPVEIFDEIIPRLAIETPTNGYTPRNKDLASCLLVSRTFYSMTLSTLYAHVTFPHSSIFSKFLLHIKKYPELGAMVKRLDFSQFTSIGLGRTRRMHYEIQKLTATTLLQCLELVPRVREFLASEALDEDIDEKVLTKLFCGLPRLEAVDFCASSAPLFVKSFTNVMSSNNASLPDAIPIKRLGFHGCTTLPISVYATLLPRLPALGHLDLTHTQVTDGSLHAIPETARLTHLSLSKCNRLHGPAVVDFLLRHPAAKSLVCLNLLYDSGRYCLLSAADLDELLPNLPSTLRSLNLSGARIDSSHTPELRRLSRHLEELSVGNADLSIADLNQLFQPTEQELAEERRGLSVPRCNLHYLDLTGVSSVTPNSLILSNNCSLLLPESFPLQVIEVSEKVTDGLRERPVTSKKLGWVVKSQHRRCWYVRAGPGTLPGAQKIQERLAAETGERSWKMGTQWWGGRKIGVARGSVSGIYGYYCFGK